jgi:hypothetical protein
MQLSTANSSFRTERDKKGRHRNFEILTGAGEIDKNLGIYQGTDDQQL